jgi:uncharacterized repeat protein (TIGR01451 family)
VTPQALYISGSTVWFTNTIIYSHTVGAQQTGGTLALYATLWYSNGANTGGTVNIGDLNPTGDPRFVDPAGGDYHLGAGSAAADSAPFAGVSADIDGAPRPLGFGYDFGADELTAPRLEMAKTVPNTFGAPGQTLTYTIRVTGSVVANLTTVVTDTIDGYQRILTATPSQGSCTIHAAGYGGYATCALGTVTTTAPALITVTAQVSPTIVSGGTLTNSAVVRSEGAAAGPVQTTLLAQDCLARINDGATEYSSPQAAVDAASAGDLVKLAGACFGVNVRSGLTQTLIITKALTVRGGYGPGAWDVADPVARPTTLNAQNLGRVLVVTTTATVENVQLTGGNAAGQRGGLGSYCNNQDVGGGVYVPSVTGAALTLHNTVIYSNTAYCGGGVAALRPLTVTNASVYSNTAREGGGGVFLYSSAALISNTQVTTNTASNVSNYTGGGGMYAVGGGQVKIYASSFISNSVATNYGKGGGLLADGGGVTLQTSLLTHNRAASGGGAFFNSSGAASQVHTNTVTENSAFAGGGGGLYFATDAGQVRANTIATNTATGQGGGFYIGYSLVFADNRVDANLAASGGGGYVGSGSAQVTANTLYSNTASGSGGALYLNDAAGSFDRNVLRDNRATSNGGGVYNFNSFGAATSASLTNNVIADNTAASGGAFYVQSASPRLVHNTLARNSSDDGAAVRLLANATVMMTNTILYSHTVGVAADSGATAGLEATLWYSTPTPTTGAGAITTGTLTLSGDPRFVDPAGGDYHLQAASAARNVGLAAGIAHDLDDHIRPMGVGYEIGADEYPEGAVALSKHTANPVATVGGVFTYTLLLTSTGQADATTVVLTDTLDAWQRATAVTSQPDAGCSFNPAAWGGSVVCQAGTLPPGALRTITITAQLSPTTPAGQSMDNEATATADPALRVTSNRVTVYAQNCQARVGGIVYTDLQQAVDSASSSATIQIAGACINPQTRAGRVQTAYITKTLTLRGGYALGGDWVTSDPVNTPSYVGGAGQQHAIYYTLTGGALTVENLEITGGALAGLWQQRGNLTLTNSRVYSNTGLGVLTSGSVTVTNSACFGNGDDGLYAEGAGTVTASRFEQNGGSGLAVYGPLTAASLTVRNNTGDGASVSDGDATVTDSDFDGNGGIGLAVPSGVLTATGNDFTGNGGGGVYTYRTTLTGGRFENNRNPGDYGGGLRINDTSTVSGTSFISNTARFGGAIDAGGVVSLTNVTLLNNTATEDGGAVRHTDGALWVTGALVQGNQAQDDGGGIAFEQGDDLYLRNVQIYSNTATTGDGGGVYAGYYAVHLDAVQVMSNTAGNDGGGLYVVGALEMPATLVQNNRADAGGGVFHNGDYGDYGFMIEDSRFLHNAARQGAALYFLRSDASYAAATIFARNHNLATDGAVVYGYRPYLVTLANNVWYSPTVAAGLAFSGTADAYASLRVQNNVVASHTVGLGMGQVTGDPEVGQAWNLFHNNGVDLQGLTGEHVNGDPRFANPASDDYHIADDSPAINGGRLPFGADVQTAIATDLDDEPRDMAPDIGLDERRRCWARLNNDATDYGHPQAAVDASSGETDVVKVAGYCAGYDPWDSGANVSINYTITVRGGYTTSNWTTPDWQAHPTTLDGLDGGVGVVAEVFGPDEAFDLTLEGLHIVNGFGGGDVRWGDGGGVYVEGNGASSATLRNCEIRDSVGDSDAGGYCGGVSLAELKSGLLEGVTIAGNVASLASEGSGGGLCIYYSTDVTVRNSVIFSNTAGLAGDAGNPDDANWSGGIDIWGSRAITLENNQIVANRAACGTCGADGYGGGVGVYRSHDILLASNTISGNVAAGAPAGREAWGGGVYVYSSTVTLDSNGLAYNRAAVTGDANGSAVFGYYTATLTLVNNLLGVNQGAVTTMELTGTTSSARLLHNTFVGNDGWAVQANAGSQVAMTNTLVAYNGGGFTGAGVLTPDYTLFYSNTALGDGVTGAHATTGVNPNLAADSWHLTAASAAAIDQGSDAGVRIDLDGQLRPIGAGFDIGADEYPSTSLYTLTVSTVGGGQVTRTPDYTAYSAGAVVTLTAQANAGSTFTGWSGDLSGATTPVTLTMDADKHITATFILNSHIITPTAGAGGAITPATPQSVSHGGTQAFTIAADAGYAIRDVGVDGVTVGTVSVYTFTNVTANHTITAAFDLLPPPTVWVTLTTATAGTGGGAVIKAPDAISYTVGTVVTLTAQANVGSTFTGWSGDLSGAMTPVTLTLDASKHVTAAFDLLPPPTVWVTLTTATAGTGGGAVLKAPDAISYTVGTVVTLTAQANVGSTFTGWSGDLSGAATPVTLTLDASKHVTATFDLVSSCTPVSGAAISLTPLTPVMGEAVVFTATVSAGTTPITYTWQWGDGTLAGSGAVVTHTFPETAATQSYTVTLTAANGCPSTVEVQQAVSVHVRSYALYLPTVRRDGGAAASTDTVTTGAEIINMAPELEPTPEPTESLTPEPTDTLTPEPTESLTPEPTESLTPEPTESLTPEPTESLTPEPTESLTPEPTDILTPEPTESLTPEPTESLTPEPTESLTPEPTESLTPEPTESLTPEPTESLTPEPTESLTPEPTSAEDVAHTDDSLAWRLYLPSIAR